MRVRRRACRRWTLFNSYFPSSRFAGQPWYGGHYPTDKNDNNYELISAGGVDLLMLHLSFWPSSDVLAWANSVLRAYPDRKAIITTHGFLGLDGSRNVHVIGSTEYIWNALVVPNDNVYFILCGRVAGEAARTDAVNGRAVHQLLADYQGLADGGQGWLRLMRFVPAEDRVYLQGLLDRGEKHLASGEILAAGEVLQHLCDKIEAGADPGKHRAIQAKALRLLGSVSRELREFRKAQEYFSRAIALDPECREALRDMADLQLRDFKEWGPLPLKAVAARMKHLSRFMSYFPS